MTDDNQHLEMLSLLIERGVDVNAANNEGQTPLHYAALSQNTEIISALIERGADTNATDKDGKMPLSYAVEHNQSPEIISLLANHRSD